MNYFFAFVMVGFLLSPMGWAEEIHEFDVLAPDDSLYVAGSLYNGDNAPNVDSVESWSHYLYCSVVYLNGDQNLEVWDVQDPTNPQLIQTLSYRNLNEGLNSYKYVPKVSVFDNCVWVRINNENLLFRPNLEGELVYQKRIKDIQIPYLINKKETDETKPGIINEDASYRMHTAGHWGTFYTILRDPEPGADPEGEYGHVILSFKDPEFPFVLHNPNIFNSGPKYFPDHVDGVIGNRPVTLAVNEEEKSIDLGYRAPMSDEYVDVLWEPHLTKFFHPDALENTLKEQVNKVVGLKPLKPVFQEAADAYYVSLDMDEGIELRDLILQFQAEDTPLKEAMETYGITREDTLEEAVEKILLRHLPENSEIDLGKKLFKPLVENWLDELLNMPIDDMAEIKNIISQTLNEGIDEDTVATFFLERYIRPLLEEETPEWMSWSMEELVQKVLEIDEVEDVNNFIQTVNTTMEDATLISLFFEIVESQLDYELEQDFPDNVPDFLDAILYERGAQLTKENLAFMEMLKLYHYYANENDDYLNFNVEFANILTESQKALAKSVVDNINLFFDSLTYEGPVSARVAAYTKDIPCRQIFAETLAAVLAHQMENAGVNTQQTVGDILKDYDLFLEWDDIPFTSPAEPADVGDLIVVLDEDIQQAEKEIREYWDLCNQEMQAYQIACKQILFELIQDQWGDFPMDNTMHQFIRRFMVHQVDTKSTWAEKLDDIMQDFVMNSMGDLPSFIGGDFQLIDRAARGDLVARWQYAFHLARELSKGDVTQAVHATFVTLEESTKEAYSRAMGAIMEALIVEFAEMMREKMAGGFENWVAKTEYHKQTIYYDYLTQLNPISVHPFAQQGRVGFVGIERWDMITPRTMSLVSMDPFAPNYDTHEYVFGNKWGHVDHVDTAKNLVGVFGSEYIGYDVIPTAMLVAMENDKMQVHKLRQWELPATQGMASVAGREYLALYGPYGVRLVPYPTLDTVPQQDEETAVGSWSLY
ncbi:hypothetical protein GF373_03445 [bacterium]|nr:hypothetical protein [bacterium]